MGGCPIGAFCDYGMCRCRHGYEERYGGCWNSRDSFERRLMNTQLLNLDSSLYYSPNQCNVDRNLFMINFRSWNRRRSSSFNPENEACSEHQTCLDMDMNLYCSTVKGRCSCREDMRWNREELECQVKLSFLVFISTL